MKIEVLASVGALVISTGGFVYLNNKINTTDESLKLFLDKFNTMVYKLNDLDDKNKISKVNLVEVQESLSKFKDIFSELKSDLSDNFLMIEKALSKQDKKFKSLEKRLQTIAENIGIEIPEEIEVEKVIKKNKQFKSGGVHKNKTIDKKPKVNIAINPIESDYLEEDVLSQMNVMGMAAH